MIAMKLSRYSIWLPSYGTQIDSLGKKKKKKKKKNTNQKTVTQKQRKRKQSCLIAPHCLLIHITIKFHQDIPYGYLVMARILIVWKKY